jgi:hypothetical protein
MTCRSKKHNLVQGEQLSLFTGVHPRINILRRLEKNIANREIKVVEMINIQDALRNNSRTS